MGEFFRGWKRKLGIVTLVTALVAMGGWVRSLVVADIMQICGRTTVLHLRSNHIGLESDFIWNCPTIGNNSSRNPSFWNTVPIAPYIEFQKSFASTQKSFLKSCGFNFASGHLSSLDPSDNNKLISISFPYWSITIPLTLISAFLLHTKPHKSTQMKFTEPIPVDGT